MARNRWWRTIAAATALALVAAACGDDGDTDDADGEEAAEGGAEGTLTVLHALTGDTDTAGSVKG